MTRDVPIEGLHITPEQFRWPTRRELEDEAKALRNAYEENNGKMPALNRGQLEKWWTAVYKTTYSRRLERFRHSDYRRVLLREETDSLHRQARWLVDDRSILREGFSSAWSDADRLDLVQDVVLVLSCNKSPAQSLWSVLDEIDEDLSADEFTEVLQRSLHQVTNKTLSIRRNAFRQQRFFTRFQKILPEAPRRLMGELPPTSIGGLRSAYGDPERCQLKELSRTELGIAVRIWSGFVPEKSFVSEDERVNAPRSFTDETLRAAVRQVNEDTAAALSARFLEEAISKAHPHLFPAVLTDLEDRDDPSTHDPDRDEHMFAILARADVQKEPFSDAEALSKGPDVGSVSTFDQADSMLFEVSTATMNLVNKIVRRLSEEMSENNAKELVVFLNRQLSEGRPSNAQLATAIGVSTQNLSQIEGRAYKRIRACADDAVDNQEVDQEDIHEVILLVVERLRQQNMHLLLPFEEPPHSTEKSGQ